MDWLIRVHDAPGDAGLRVALEAWIAADPRHAHAWDEARRAWQKIGEVAPLRADTGKHEVGRRGTPLKLGIGLAAATLAACLVLLIFPSLLLRIQADHATTSGELRRVTLQDGTAVHLAPLSAIALRFTAAERRVSLLAGDAFFEVAANPDRPFVVEAAGLESKVIGTAFDMRRSERTLSIAVQSGMVVVRHAGATPPLDDKLDPGDRVTVDRQTGRAERDRVRPQDVATWRQGQLFVADVPVAQVVDELRRYQPGWIVIADDRLAQQRVTGLYDLRNPDGALRALVRPYGGEVRSVTPLLKILSMP